MSKLKATVDNLIRVDRNSIPSGVEEQICAALTFDNLAKEKAEKQYDPSAAEMPDEIEMWSVDGDNLLLPRGFAQDFQDGLEALDLQIHWNDNRTYKASFRLGNKIDLSTRPYQPPMVEAMQAAEQGILMCPPGGGKTVAFLEFIRRTTGKSLIIVNTKNIAEQWKDRTQEFLGENYPIGMIGDGQFEVSPYLTIASQQTLWSKRYELDEQGFFDLFSIVGLDECHHVTALTFKEILNRFSARFRLGMSGTPAKTGDFRVAKSVLGPVFHRTPKRELREAGVLTDPKIYVIPTRFGYDFRSASRGKRSNYPQMIKALVEDEERNELIVENIMKDEGHCILVLSKRLGHLDYLAKRCVEEGHKKSRIYMLTGRESTEKRMIVYDKAAKGRCIIFSTIADEALDIPRLDRVHLAFPQKNADLVRQQIGRVERVHPKKTDAFVYDYMDGNIDPLKGQYRTRRFEVYEIEGYRIIKKTKEKQ